MSSKGKGRKKGKGGVAEDTPKKTSPYMSIYEYTALITARASAISNSGGFPSIGAEDVDPIIIARREVDGGHVTLMIRRHLSDGTYEDWRPSDMVYPRC